MTSARIIDLSLLTAPEGFILQGDQDNALAGYSVSAAGDVNGDGIADLIVGARTGNAGGDYAGQAHVIYGQAGTTRLTVDLSSLAASEGFTVQGDMALDYLGAGVSFAGDVNGDGVGDLIVGAPQGGDGGTDAGEAYVIYGQAGATRGTLDLTGLAASDGFVIQGDAAGDYAGYSVSGGHDVNGDGIADMIVGAYQGDDGGISAGEAYVIYGQAGVTRTTVDLTGLAASDGFIIQGDAAGDLAGRSVSMARDLNGDGIADMIVGALLGDDGGTSAGEAYVIYGQAGTTRTLLDLSTLSVGDGFIILGDTDDDTAGSGVSDAGDVNGDGIGDLLVGAYGDDDGGDLSGAVYVIYGQAGATRGTLDLSTLSASDGFIIQGDLSGDRLGQAVSAAGDVNGDGLDDVIVGARLQDGGGTDAGAAYVIYGQAGTSRGTVDLSALDAADGFIVQGDVAGDEAGFAVSGGGDVNGDGIDDVIVGAPLGGDGGPAAGEGYVIYGGSATGFGAEVTLATLGAPYGFTINGAAAGDAAGYSVDLIGDVNGDGIGDMLVGAVTAEDGGVAAGAAYVIYGQAGATRTTLDLGSLSASEGYVVIGDMPGDLAGTSVSGAGDINGDGIGDLIIGAPFGDDGGNRAGEAYILYGAAGTTRTVLDLTGLNASDGFVVKGDSALDYSSAAVSGAGDVNGDGIGDLLVPAKQGDDAGGDAGEVYVVFGQAGNSRTLIDLTGFGGSDGFIIQGDVADDRAGVSVAGAGDINGDGIADMIVGAHRGDDGGANAGEAYVIYGQAGATRGLVDLTGLSASDGFIIQGDLAGDEAGFDVAGAGDINGDGIDDMIVGALNHDGSGIDAGAAYVVFGQGGSARTTLDLSSLSPSEGFRIAGVAAGDQAGRSVAGGGDVNGDGIDDLIVGAPGSDTGGADAGAAYVIYGRRPSDAVTRSGTDQGEMILGGQADDTLEGSGGNDTLDGGSGADNIDGGAGKDTLLFRYADAGVAVDLNTGLGTGGEAAGDTVTAVERIEGSGFGDTLGGDGAANVLRGEAGDDVVLGRGGNDRIRGGEGADNLNGGGGQDWLDYQDSDVGVSVNLATGTVSGGFAAGDTITAFEKIEGSDFGDDLTGSAGGNAIRGGAGGDTLDGGAGLDWLDYGGSDAGVSVDLSTGVVSGGHAAGDVITGFERVIGSDFDDVLTGTDDKNNLYGQDGADTITGGDGTDRVRGGAGADSLDGGDGRDWLDYRGSDGAISVDLGTGVVSGGHAEGDVIAGFERVYAGDFDDILTGDDERNQLRGGDGNDTLDGGTDNDKLFGEDDDDTFIFSAGRDTIDGGKDDDELILTGNQAAFTVVTNGAFTTVTEIATGDSARLEDVETLVFDDGNVLL